MSSSAPEAQGPGLDEFVEAYEQAQARDGRADLRSFLPDPDHPLYRAVLVELIRVELEYDWERGRPKGLDYYRLLFPELADDEQALESLYYEDYSPRVQAEEAPPAEQTRKDTEPDLEVPEAAARAVQADQAGAERLAARGPGPDSDNMPPPVPEAPAAPPNALCPVCGTRLVDPAGFGLCPNCRYCRTLAEAEHIHLGPLAASLRKKTECRDLLALVPRWGRVLAYGVVAIGLASFFVGRCVPFDAPGRALWTAGQLAVGLAIVLAGKMTAFQVVSMRESDLGFLDLVISDRLWLRACQALPESRWAVWLGGWGAALIVGGIVFVGGLSYWL